MGLYKLDLKRTNAESYRGINVNVIGLPRGEKIDEGNEGEREKISITTNITIILKLKFI